MSQLQLHSWHGFGPSLTRMTSLPRFQAALPYPLCRSLAPRRSPNGRSSRCTAGRGRRLLRPESGGFCQRRCWRQSPKPDRRRHRPRSTRRPALPATPPHLPLPIQQPPVHPASLISVSVGSLQRQKGSSPFVCAYLQFVFALRNPRGAVSFDCSPQVRWSSRQRRGGALPSHRRRRRSFDPLVSFGSTSPPALSTRP